LSAFCTANTTPHSEKSKKFDGTAVLLGMLTNLPQRTSVLKL
jgi:hypothetical protein